MIGIYQIPIKNTLVDIEVTSYTPAYKCRNEHPEFRFPDEPMEFEWKAITDNELLNRILEEDFYIDIDSCLMKILDNLWKTTLIPRLEE